MSSTVPGRAGREATGCPQLNTAQPGMAGTQSSPHPSHPFLLTEGGGAHSPASFSLRSTSSYTSMASSSNSRLLS